MILMVDQVLPVMCQYKPYLTDRFLNIALLEEDKQLKL